MDNYEQMNKENDPAWTHRNLPPPSSNNLTVYTVTLTNKKVHKQLRSDSFISLADAYLKAWYYDKYIVADLAGDTGIDFNGVYPRQVPFDFAYYPSRKTKDPNIELDQLINNTASNSTSRMSMATDAPSTMPETQQDNAQQEPNKIGKRPVSSLKKSSYGQHVIQNDDQPRSRIQRMLAMNTEITNGLKMNENNESFLATINILASEDEHPVQNLIEHMKIIATSGSKIDPKFAILPVFKEMSEEFPALTQIDRDFPSSAKEIIHYAHIPQHWQLIRVQEGQRDDNGNQRRQANIYAIIRLFSSFNSAVIIRLLLPELDELGLRLNIKGVQLPDTEVTIVFLGIHPDTCPEGFKAAIVLAFKDEADAMVKRGELTAIERGELSFDNIHFKTAGIKSTKLTNPADQQAFGTEGLMGQITKGVVMETPASETALIHAFIDAAHTSGTLKAYTGTRTCPKKIPQGRVSQQNSRRWQQLKRANAGLIFNSVVSHLNGIIDPFL
jgi:hypothetical protein